MTSIINEHERYKFISGYGESYFSINSCELQSDLQYIKCFDIGNIIINANDLYINNNLDVLKDLEIKKIIITPPIKGKFYFEGLKFFSQLEYLKVNNSKADEIDLKENKLLKKVYIENGSKIKGLENLSLLESLIITKPASYLLSCKVFENLTSLRHLTLAGTSIDEGFHFLSKNRFDSMFLYGLKFVDFDGIDLVGINKLQVEKCKNVLNEQVILNMDSLTELMIVDSFNVKSAESLSKLTKLEFLTVMGNSIIEDGDLSPLKFKLKHFSFDDKRHYSIKYDKFKNEFLIRKGK
jgi:hypothetical protein